MQFYSFKFILLFLPISLLIYFKLVKKHINYSKPFICIISFLFYLTFGAKLIYIIISSIILNFIASKYIKESDTIKTKKLLLFVGVLLNVLMLGYFKYINFFILNLSLFSGLSIKTKELMSTVAISFYTFQQISFLIDIYKGKIKKINILDYVLYIMFFPKLLEGPIIGYNEFIDNVNNKDNVVNYNNLYKALFLFSIGMFKKLIIADNLSLISNLGYSLNHMSFIEAWITSLAYTFEIYFDFSGFIDMGIAVALMFNIKLPQNFNSPYKALNLQDFWRRWHMTLGKFLKNYIYIPLGGNRKGQFKTYVNLIVTFLVCGIWHGAGWTFILWGLLHGVGQAVQRLWGRTGLKINKWLSWFITFNFVNIGWVFFRSSDISKANKILGIMSGYYGIELPQKIFSKLPFLQGYFKESMGFNLGSLKKTVVIIFMSIVISLFLPNSNEIVEKHIKLNIKYILAIAIIIFFCFINMNNISGSIYQGF